MSYCNHGVVEHSRDWWSSHLWSSALQAVFHLCEVFQCFFFPQLLVYNPIQCKLIRREAMIIPWQIRSTDFEYLTLNPGTELSCRRSCDSTRIKSMCCDDWVRFQESYRADICPAITSECQYQPERLIWISKERVLLRTGSVNEMMLVSRQKVVKWGNWPPDISIIVPKFASVPPPW